MNSSQGVKTNVGKNRRERRKKTSNDIEETGDKTKPIVVADFENHTDCRDLAQLQKMNSRIETSVGKKRRCRRRKTSNDSVVVKEKVEVKMISNGGDELSLEQECWGHNHAECHIDEKYCRELNVIIELEMKMKMEELDEEETKMLLMELDQAFAYLSDED